MGRFPPPDSIGRVGVLWGSSPVFGGLFGGSGASRGGGMRVEVAHSLDLSPAEARRLQGELAPRVVEGPVLDLSRVRYVAGADVSTQGDEGFATVAGPVFPQLGGVRAPGHRAPLTLPLVPRV